MDDMAITNVAFYAFFKPGFELRPAQELLEEQMLQLGIKGTIILAPEGINASLAGYAEKMVIFLNFLFENIKIPQPAIKTSFSAALPFKRGLVKIKKNIVAIPGATPVDPCVEDAAKISPEEFHQWLQEGRPMVILDTRNGYEYELGHFKGSGHLGIRHFAHFEYDLQKAPAEWKHMPVVAYCTGGIRCEKAAPLMLKKGFEEVYQLEGGILNYFEKIGRGYFEGECFVFDGRIGLNETLVS